MVSLQMRIADMILDPPIILASGVLGQTAESLSASSKHGFGAVVTKSIGMEPRVGHPNPTMVELDYGLLNAMGLPNQGIDAFSGELHSLLMLNEDLPVITSIFASNEQQFTELARIMEKNGASALELNLSCPHAKGYGAALGTDPEMAGSIVLSVCESVKIPVFAKLPPVDNISAIALAVQGAGASGVVVINTIKAMSIDVETEKPFLGNKVGGYSGPAVKPVGVRCVWEVYEEVDIPVIGCGGITTGKDAVEYMLAGASAVQVGSAIYYRGKDAPYYISSEIIEILDAKGVNSLEEIIGSAHG